MTSVTFLMAVLLAGSGLALPADSAKPVALVVVNGDTITSADMDRQIIAMHGRLESDKIGSFDYSKLLDKLVNDRLLVQEAKAMGMNEEDAFVAKLRELQTDRARRLFVKEAFRPNIQISDEQILKRFESFYFKIQFRTLAVASREEAARIRSLVKNGAPMDSIAREVSLDTRRFKGGLHGLMYWRDVPIVLRLAAQNLKPGEISQPFKYEDAWMILRVEERMKADPDELDQWTPEIREILTNTERDLAWRKFLDSLAVIYPARVDSSLLNDIRADSSQVFKGDFMRGSNRTVIQVGTTDSLSEEELRREISHAAMNLGNQVFDTIMNRAIEGAITEARLNAAAQDQGYMNKPSVLAYLAGTSDSLLLDDYLSENIVDRIKFNHAEFEEYYREHQEDFRRPDDVQLKALQLDSQDNADRAEALLDDGADFDYVAKQLARPDGVEHDEDQWFSLGSFPTDVGEELKGLKPGQHTTALKLADGWVIFEVKARRPGGVKTIEEVDGQIRQVMFRRKFDELLDGLLAELKGASKIVYNQQAIDEYLGADSKS